MPGDHEDARNLGKLGDDVLCDPVAEILLFGIARHVLEGQYGDRRLVGQRQRVPGCVLVYVVAVTGTYPIDPDRLGDVLDGLFALVLETERELIWFLRRPLESIHSV